MSLDEYYSYFLIKEKAEKAYETQLMLHNMRNNLSNYVSPLAFKNQWLKPLAIQYEHHRNGWTVGYYPISSNEFKRMLDIAFGFFFDEKAEVEDADE